MKINEQYSDFGFANEDCVYISDIGLHISILSLICAAIGNASCAVGQRHGWVRRRPLARFKGRGTQDARESAGRAPARSAGSVRGGWG
jgi:hypothetical protein